MIKAIQTKYAGYLFRSRLEARWAVFFDALKLDWKYEPEGFQLPSGAFYLPDFRVQFGKTTVWFEIKPDDKESELLTEFINGLPPDNGGSILNDIPDPRHVEKTNGQYYYGNSERPNWNHGGGGWDNYHRFCVCDSCKRVGFEFDGRSARIGCGCAIHRDSDKNYTPSHPLILKAFAAARSARFEHDHREKY